MTLQLYLTIIWRHTTCFSMFSARKQIITHILGLVCWPIVTKLPTFFQVFNNVKTAALFVFISLDLVGEMLPFSYLKGIPGTNTIIAKLEVIDCAYSILFGFPALFITCVHFCYYRPNIRYSTVGFNCLPHVRRCNAKSGLSWARFFCRRYLCRIENH